MRVGLVLVGMDRFSPSTRLTARENIEQIRCGDWLVDILDHQYGWTPDGEKRSTTEIERDTAEGKLPSLIFVFNESSDVSSGNDFDPGDDLRVKQEKRSGSRSERDVGRPDLSDEGGARVVQEREDRALEELIKVFKDRDLAMLLLAKVKFPVSRISVSTTTPFVFWNQVAEEARHGVLPGGMQPILAAAAEMYPNNPVFVRYHRSRSSDEPARSRRHSSVSSVVSSDSGSVSSEELNVAARQYVLKFMSLEMQERAMLKPHGSARSTQCDRQDRTPTAGDVDVITVAGGLKLLRIPGGSFSMGSPSNEEGRKDTEGPQCEVEIFDFYMAPTPVTNAQYGEFLRENPGVNPPKHWTNRRYAEPSQPVVGVSWYDAEAYCKWAGVTLPTEKQWEYACRAGTTTRYHAGSDVAELAKVAWCTMNSRGRLHAVAQKIPNAFGLYDMHGNVFEWCEDEWSEQAEQGDGSGFGSRPGRDRRTERVARGGSWNYDASYARSASRYYYGGYNRGRMVGFRVVRPI